MHVSVEATSNIERRMTIEVPEDVIKKEFDSRIQRLAKRAKMDGFRPGKAPITEVIRRFGASVKAEVLEDIMHSSFVEAINEKKLRPAGAPVFENQLEVAGKPFSYVVIFEVFPEFTPVDLSGASIETLKASVTDQDVDNLLEKLRKQHTEWEEVERAAANGDRVMIDFVGMIDDAPFEGGTAQDFSIILGSKSMIPGFEEGLIGVTSNNQTAIEVTFPKDYHAVDLAGKPAQFKIKVKEVKSAKPLEFTEEFVSNTFHIKGGEAALREEIRKNMEKELKNVMNDKNKAAVMKKIAELNPLEIPKSAIERGAHHLKDQALTRMKHQMKLQKTIDIPIDLFLEEAKQRVLLSLIINAFIKEYDLKVNEAAVEEKIKQIASNYQDPNQIVEWYHRNQEQLRLVQASVLENQVVEKLLEKANVDEKTISYEEMMGSSV